MIDQVARGALLAGYLFALIVALTILRKTERPSRRGSIVAMFPTLLIFIVFESTILFYGSGEFARWTSRLGRVSIIATLLYQLWSIDYAETAERRIRDTTK